MLYTCNYLRTTNAYIQSCLILVLKLDKGNPLQELPLWKIIQTLIFVYDVDVCELVLSVNGVTHFYSQNFN